MDLHRTKMHFFFLLQGKHTIRYTVRKSSRATLARSAIVRTRGPSPQNPTYPILPLAFPQNCNESNGHIIIAEYHHLSHEKTPCLPQWKPPSPRTPLPTGDTTQTPPPNIRSTAAFTFPCDETSARMHAARSVKPMSFIWVN